MLIRKISAIVRGRVTPFQITAACVLGSMLGFVPMFETARGLVVALVLALLILNANLFLAGVATALAKLVSLAIVPATFGVGRALLDGPTEGLFRWAVNAPVIALFGLEHYLTSGGVVMGAALGIVLAVMLVRAISSFRRRMASIETSSDLYRKLTARRSVRVLMFVLIGKGKGKKSYADLLGRRMGNPVRITGVAIALMAVALLFIGKAFLTERLLTSAIVRGLEQANGATVDLDAAHLSLAEQRLTLTGLAMADRADLGRDLFRAATIEVDVDVTDLLRGRLTLDHVAVADALQGAARTVPGRLVGTPRPRAHTTAPAPQGGKPLEEYLAQAQKWKQRLEQLADLLDRIPRSDPRAQPTDPAQAKRDRAELLRRRIALLGYARVRADHLIEGAPMLLVRVLDVDGLGVASQAGRVYDIHAERVSTQPWLLPEPARVQVASRDGNFNASLVMDERIEFAVALKNLDADEVSKGLSTPEPLMRGGTLDASITGVIGPGPTHAIDLPLLVAIHNTRLHLPQIGSTDVKEFTLSIQVAGSLYDPRIRVDPDALTQALADAGAHELANLLQKELGKVLGDIDLNAGDLGKLGDELNKKAGEVIKGLLGGGG